MKQRTELKKITVAAILCAVAFLCVFLFRFKVNFLTFDFKDAVLAVIGFLYGPIYALASAAIVSVIEFLSVSDTGVYGLIMNFLSSAAFASVCGLFYRYKRTLSGAVIGSIFAVFVMTAIMLLANIFITPFYMHMPRQAVIDILPTLLLPFNLVKGIVNAAITMLIYKPVCSVFKKMGLIISGNKSADKKSFVLIAAVSLLVIALATFVILFILDGKFEFI